MSDSVWPHRWQPPGSPVPEILQARTLEWVAISFSNAWKWKVKVKSFSCVQLLAIPWTAAHQAPPSMGLSRQEYWSGVPFKAHELFISEIYHLIFSDKSWQSNWNHGKQTMDKWGPLRSNFFHRRVLSPLCEGRETKFKASAGSLTSNWTFSAQVCNLCKPQL